MLTTFDVFVPFKVCFGGNFGLRGKSWSIEEERQLRELVKSGVSVDNIAQIMGKPRLSIRGKINNLSLTVVVAARLQGTAATTTITTPSPEPIRPLF